MNIYKKEERVKNKMTKPQSERAFQNFLKDTIRSEGGWVSQLHPGMGSDIGIPDLLLATDFCGILPAELKIGSIDQRVLKSASIRPSQIAWHLRLTNHGQLSSILVGVPENKGWRIFAVDGIFANKVRDGFVIGKEAIELDPRFFTAELNDWAETSYNLYYEKDF